MSEPDWVTRVRAVVADTHGRVLVVAANEGDRLPFVEVEGSWEELDRITRKLAALVGFETVVVRTVARSVDEERHVLELGLELEPTAEPATPGPGAAWRMLSELGDTQLTADDRVLVELHASDEPPPERAPWMRRGFVSEATAWIDDALAGVGRTRVAPVEQLSNWCISSILRAETEAGRVYFKATAASPLFVDEGTVTRGLASFFPGSVPAPIAVDAERRWMLLDDFGEVVGWDADPKTRLAVLTAFARIQREAASLHEELVELGVLDRRLAWLRDELGSLAGSAVALGLEASEADELARLTPRLVDACEQLAAGAVPDSLVHGDLHLSNVARGDGAGYVFFDWTDACLAHPFLDLLFVVSREDADERRALRDAYLGEWADYAPPDELLELWRLAEPLAALNQAISYRAILANVEPGTAPELEPLGAHWLRRGLAAAAAWDEDPAEAG